MPTKLMKSLKIMKSFTLRSCISPGLITGILRRGLMIKKIFSNGGKGSPFVAALVVPLSHTSVIHETLKLGKLFPFIISGTKGEEAKTFLVLVVKPYAWRNNGKGWSINRSRNFTWSLTSQGANWIKLVTRALVLLLSRFESQGTVPWKRLSQCMYLGFMTSHKASHTSREKAKD